MAYVRIHKTIWVSHLVACLIIFILFYEESWQGGVFKVMKNDEILEFFSRLDPFPQAFGQVKEQLILGLQKTKLVPHLFACSIVFILFYERSSQGGVFKIMKNDHFLVF